jgi:glutathione synthase/RimK-type ligase-like ATP-grasp enzyme
VIAQTDCQRGLQRAREHVAAAQDEAAKLAYLDALRADPTSLPALNELGALARATGHRSAARTIHHHAVRHHPADPVGRVALANLLAEDAAFGEARHHYREALNIDPACAEAHRGLARVLTELDDPAADFHWQQGFVGNATYTQRYRGNGAGVPVLLLVSARGGNIPTRQWIDDRIFAVTALYADFHDPATPLPPHQLVINAIGDADRCDFALRRAEAIVERTTAPVINPPRLIRATGRADNARRLGDVPGVVAPRTITQTRPSLLAAADDLSFPLLLRAPGFHTGQHFIRVEAHEELATATASLPRGELLAIEYLHARGPDGMARKYRVMFIDGVCYPLHLAISLDWKVHYFTAGMADSAALREEECRFLNDMPAILGAGAVTALSDICGTLGLDYAGVDFALAPNGSVLLFEANATVVIVPPGPDPMWDYRRPAITAAQQAARRMLTERQR